MKRRVARRIAARAWHKRFIVRDRKFVTASGIPWGQVCGRWEWTQRGNFTGGRRA